MKTEMSGEIRFRLPEEIRKKLEALALENRTTLSETVRQLLYEAMDEYENETRQAQAAPPPTPVAVPVVKLPKPTVFKRKKRLSQN